MVRCKNDITPLHVYTKCLHYNDLQNTLQKAKDRATRTPLNTGDELGCPEGWEVPAPLGAHTFLLQLQTR